MHAGIEANDRNMYGYKGPCLFLLMELTSHTKTVSCSKEKVNLKKKIKRIVYKYHLLLTVYGCWNTND